MTDGSFSKDSARLNLTKEEVAEEDALLRFNRNFQASVLKHLDYQLQKFHDEIDKRDHELGQTQLAREDLALALRDVKRLIPDLQKTIETTQKELSAVHSAKRDLEYHATQTDAELVALRKLSLTNSSEIQRLQGDLEKATEENANLHVLQNVAAQDFKMHHVYEQSLKSEITHLADDKRQMQRALHQWQNRFEKTMETVRDVSCEASVQKDQTKLAEVQVAATVKEMELLLKSNELLISRWEQSIDAMDERDQVLKRNSVEIAATRKQLRTLEVLAARAESDNDDLQAQHASLQRQREQLLQANDTLKANLNESRRAAIQTEKALENTGLAYRQVLAGLTQAKKHEAAQQEKMAKVQQELVEEKAAVTMLKRQILDLKDKEQSTSEMVARRLIDADQAIADECSANQRLSVALQAAQMRSEQMIATLESELARAQEQNRQLELASQMTKARWETAEKHTSHLRANLSMMESRAFAAEQKVAELADAPVQAERKWTGQVTALQTALATTRAELTTARALCSDLHKTITRADRRNDAIDGERQKSESTATVITSKSRRLEADLKAQQRAESGALSDLELSRAQARLQASKLYSEQTQRLAQEKALVDAEFRQQAAVVECQSTIDAYKQELAKVRADRCRQGQELAKATQDRARAETATKTSQMQLASVRDQLDRQLSLVRDLHNQIAALKRDRLTNDKRFQGWAVQLQARRRRRHQTLPAVVGARDSDGPSALEQLRAESEAVRARFQIKS